MSICEWSPFFDCELSCESLQVLTWFFHLVLKDDFLFFLQTSNRFESFLWTLMMFLCCDFLNFGLSITSPFDKTAKLLIPKSIPIVLLESNISLVFRGLDSSFVSTRIDTQYSPQLSFEIVIDLWGQLTSKVLFLNNLTYPIFGIKSFHFSKLIFGPVMQMQSLPRFLDLNLCSEFLFLDSCV